MYALHVAPPYRIGAFRRPSSGGRAASGAGWLVAIVCVRLSAITIGAQIDTPHRRPPSRSQSAWASLKYSCARCWSTCAAAGRGWSTTTQVRTAVQNADIRIVYSPAVAYLGTTLVPAMRSCGPRPGTAMVHTAPAATDISARPPTAYAVSGEIARRSPNIGLPT